MEKDTSQAGQASFFKPVVFDSIHIPVNPGDLKVKRGSKQFYMLRTYAFMFFSFAIGSAFLLKVTHLPDPLILFTFVCTIVGTALANLMLIRTTGMAIGVGGLIFVYHNAPEPSLPLASLLAFLATLLIAATGLLIAADLSDAKEKPSLEL